jgi:inhibitor of KinA
MMKWRAYGPHALLVQFADAVGDDAFESGCAIATYLEEQPPRGLREFVSGFTTVLLDFDHAQVSDPRAIAPEVVATLESAARQKPEPGPIKEIPVTYNGPDIERVAATHGLSVAEVCELHSEPVYKVYLLGFAPGFPYLGDLNPKLHTPRLSSPRPRVAAGSIGIGGQHTGIYTVESPGGWNIIGQTRLKIFDPARRDPDERAAFWLKQGDRVKFVT